MKVRGMFFVVQGISDGIDLFFNQIYLLYLLLEAIYKLLYTACLLRFTSLQI